MKNKKLFYMTMKCKCETKCDLEVDHIISLEMVSDAFSDVFTKVMLETCLKVRSCTCSYFLTDSIHTGHVYNHPNCKW